MHDMSAVLAADGRPRLHDGLFDAALEIVDRHVLRHLAVAGMDAADVGLEIREGEQPDRPGRPALRVSMGAGDVLCGIWIDWNGTLSWGRPRTWLDRRVLRQIARRRWMVEMEAAAVDPAHAPFDRRNVDPLLAVVIRDGLLSMDQLASGAGHALHARYAVSDGSNGFRRAPDYHARTRVVVSDVPAMDIRVDHDRVFVERLALSEDVVLRHPEDEVPSVRLGRHRLPHTALFSLAGCPLSDLVDSPLLDRRAMPVIGRMRVRPNGAQEAVLACNPDGQLDTEDLDA